MEGFGVTIQLYVVFPQRGWGLDYPIRKLSCRTIHILKKGELKTVKPHVLLSPSVHILCILLYPVRKENIFVNLEVEC